MTRTAFGIVVDAAYARLRYDGVIHMPFEVREEDGERGFERILAALRRRAARDGYRVHTRRGTRRHPVPLYARVFELHHPPRKIGVHDQPRGIATPDASVPADT